MPQPTSNQVHWPRDPAEPLRPRWQSWSAEELNQCSFPDRPPENDPVAVTAASAARLALGEYRMPDPKDLEGTPANHPGDKPKTLLPEELQENPTPETTGIPFPDLPPERDPQEVTAESAKRLEEAEKKQEARAARRESRSQSEQLEEAEDLMTEAEGREVLEKRGDDPDDVGKGAEPSERARARSSQSAGGSPPPPTSPSEGKQPGPGEKTPRS